MQELKHVFEFVSLRKLIQKRTNLKYASNLASHIMGKAATKKDTRTEPTPDELIEINKGLIELAEDIKRVAKKK